LADEKRKKQLSIAKMLQAHSCNSVHAVACYIKPPCNFACTNPRNTVGLAQKTGFLVIF